MVCEQTTRSAREVDDETTIEADIRALWDRLRQLREGGLPLSRLIAIDEKPIWWERHEQRVWRSMGTAQAIVRSDGKTRERLTVLLPSAATGKKLPIIFVFRGKNQLHVEVPEGYPCLIVFTETAVVNSGVFIYILERAIMPNLEQGDNAILLDEFTGHISATTTAWLTQQTHLDFVPIKPPLTKSAQHGLNLFFLVQAQFNCCRYVQPADKIYNATDGQAFDKRMQEALVAGRAEKAQQGQPAKFSVADWRSMIVQAGCKAWYEDVSVEAIKASYLHSGLSNALDGSQNMQTDVSLASGKRLYPSYGQTGTDQSPLSMPGQLGFGVQVVGQGAEIVRRPSIQIGSVQQSKQDISALQVVHDEKDSTLNFPTEKEKQQEIKAKETGEMDEAADEGKDESNGEEHLPFDESNFFAKAAQRLGYGVRITRKPPSASELAKGQLVQKAIAFHFSDGWDVGVVANTENPAKFTKSKFNYNVRYDAKGGTIRHCLELQNYGTGSALGAPLGAWMLLERDQAPPPPSFRKLSLKRKDPPLGHL